MLGYAARFVKSTATILSHACGAARNAGEPHFIVKNSPGIVRRDSLPPSSRGSPATLGSTLAARSRRVFWCNDPGPLRIARVARNSRAQTRAVEGRVVDQSSIVSAITRTDSSALPSSESTIDSSPARMGFFSLAYKNSVSDIRKTPKVRSPSASSS